MCMKYVNATTYCYESVIKENDNPVSFNKPFNGVVAIKHSDGSFSIGGFKIVTQISLLGTNTQSNKEFNIIEKKGALDVVIRLTKCDQNEENQLGRDLDAFTIDLQKMSSQLDQACYQFLNYTRITEVSGINLVLGIGNYVLKVLVKDSEDENYTIQTMSRLKVVSP